jgi:glutamate dehydrogenase
MLSLTDAIIARHHPSGLLVTRPGEFHARLNALPAEHVNDRMAVSIARAIQCTNAFVPNRGSLVMRLNPEVASFRDPVAAMYYVSGESFTGYHIRFRTIARGGLRVVCGKDIFTALTECYELARTQHAKNKDIPEGGAKGVLFVTDPTQIDDAVHAMVEGLLDCAIPHPAVVRGGDQLFLGPDERITPAHIEFMVTRAAERGYASPRTFMTSKSHTGFNHKEFGVTSEGVEIFMYESMRKLMFPRLKPFTVKITGGPDGDVAGNFMRILYREYGELARVVGIADGTAVCEDPAGIAWSKLLPLLDENLPLSCLPGSSLDMAARDTMHARVKADVFVPAGGRPWTITEQNCAAVGRTTRLIVEGANMFLTSGARDMLTRDHGVMIMKDSSANKCGVICSSMEVLTSMLLTDEEIVQNKATIVAEVLEYLKRLARIEARALLAGFPANRYVHKMSEEMTDVAVRKKDSIYHSFLADADVWGKLDEVVRPTLPPTIVRLGWARAREQIPIEYQKMMIASTITREVIYKVHSW